MTQEISRRTILKLIVGTTLATAFNFLYPGISTAIDIGSFGKKSIGLAPGTNVKEMKGPDPTYAGGKVVAKNSDGVVLQSESGVRGVRFPSQAVVWKEFDVTPEAIELDDWVDVKGLPLNDGILLAQSGWVFVNIGRLDGAVDQVSEKPNMLTVKTKRGQKLIELSQRLEIIRAKDGLPLSDHISALTSGVEMGAVGLRLPDGGFRATRIWVY